VSATATKGRWWRHRLYDLRYALLWGPEQPAPMLRGLSRSSAFHTWALAAVLGLVGAILLVWSMLAWTRPAVSAWPPVIIVLSLVLLVVMVRRPLLAWRIAALALLYELLVRGTRVHKLIMADQPWLATPYALPLAEYLPPLLVSELQLVVLLVVLFVAAASQPRGVVFWVWVATATLVLLVPVAWTSYATYYLMDRWHRFGWLGTPYAFWDRAGYSLLLTVAGLVVVTSVVLAGQLVRGRAITRQQLVEVEERGLVLDERARIARELHDVVAHHVSMIAVRAETAPFRLGKLPDQARREFAEISQASRESLTEMRRLLGVLRSDGPAPTTPQPGLADLAELVEWTRAAGTPITLEMHGSMAGLPAAVDVSAYRILQEALTNAARHATGAPAHLRLERTDMQLSLSVRSGPRPPAAGGDHGAPPAGEGGHGVRGMRERAAMLGGELHAGPTADGGFEVTTTLPLRPDAA
jgi:signal transduction histidine kinase